MRSRTAVSAHHKTNMAASMYASQFVGYPCSKSIKLRPFTTLGNSCRYLFANTRFSSTEREKPVSCWQNSNTKHCVNFVTPLLLNESILKIVNGPIIPHQSRYIENKSNQFNKFMPLKKTYHRNSPNRNYSSEGNDGGPDKKVVMHLMDFPEVVWPSLIKSLRNWILSNLIITPYFDREFNLADFVDGSKKAFEIVTECLSESRFDKLQGLVASDAIDEVKRNISLFSVQKRQELRMIPDDIYFCFPYQVGVMFSDDDENQKRFVEITMCYHVLQGLTELKSQGVTPPINMGMMPEYRDKIHICNYRFIREFSKGVEDQWTINKLNHFKPSDYIT